MCSHVLLALNFLNLLFFSVWDSAIQPGFSQVAEQGANFAARQAVQRLNSTASTNSTIPPMSVKKRH